MVDLPHSIIAGRLKHLHKVWNRLSQDKWIHQTVQGFQIPLLATPVQRPSQLPVMNNEMSSILNEKLHSLLSRAIIVRSGITSSTSQTYVSAVFTILKKNGEHRLILNPISIESMSQGNILKWRKPTCYQTSSKCRTG